MALQVPIELDGVYYVLVDDSTSRAITGPVCVVVTREKSDMVALPDDDEGDLWGDTKILTSS